MQEENAMNGSVLSWFRVGVRESPRGWAVEPHCPSRPSRPGGQGRGQQEPAWRARTLRIFFESFSSAIGLAMADSSLTVPMLAIELYPLPSLSLSLFVALSLAHDRRPHSTAALPLPEFWPETGNFFFAGTLVFGQDFVLVNKVPRQGGRGRGEAQEGNCSHGGGLQLVPHPCHNRRGRPGRCCEPAHPCALPTPRGQEPSVGAQGGGHLRPQPGYDVRPHVPAGRGEQERLQRPCRPQRVRLRDANEGKWLGSARLGSLPSNSPLTTTSRPAPPPLRFNPPLLAFRSFGTPCT